MSFLRPLRDQIIVEKEDEELVSKAGLLLPRNQGKKSRWARVVAVGPGRTLKDGTKKPLPYQIGDRVYLDVAAGPMILINNRKFWFANDYDVLAVESMGEARWE